MTSPTVVTTRERELRQILHAAWPDATIEPSALEYLPRINLAALRAVVEAGLTIPSLPTVVNVAGWKSYEDPDWIELLLVTSARPAPGSDEWHELLDAMGKALEVAMENHPDLIDDIASQISFDF